jgi:hypothetical protein
MTSKDSAALLLHCLSDSRGLAVDSRVSAAACKEVARAAAAYDLAPLLYTRLKSSGTRAWFPADVWEQLRLAYFSSADRNLRLRELLRLVLGSLRNAGISVIVLKGAYLAEAVYGDVAVRPMCDVDLLVPRADLPEAQSVLLGLGGVSASAADIEWCCRTSSHLPAIVFRGLVFEVHWTIAAPVGPVSVDVAGLWDRARPACIAGVQVRALSPEDLLLHLCLSASCRDGFMGGLRSFGDIAETIRRFGDEIDWVHVTGRAHEWGGARYVCLTLHLARSMFGAEVPDGVIERLVPGGPDQCVVEAASESVLTRAGYDKMIPLSYDHLGAESVGDKARLVWRRIFLSREDMGVKYPASRDAKHFWFYYVLRLRDVMGTYWSHVLARARLTARNTVSSRQTLVASWLKSGKP